MSCQAINSFFYSFVCLSIQFVCFIHLVIRSFIRFLIHSLFEPFHIYNHVIYFSHVHTFCCLQVKCILYDETGKASREYSLDNPGHNDFERGNTDTFLIHGLHKFGKVTKIEIWRQGWKKDKWFADYILVQNHNTVTEHFFPINELVYW